MLIRVNPCIPCTITTSSIQKLSLVGGKIQPGGYVLYQNSGAFFTKKLYTVPFILPSLLACDDVTSSSSRLVGYLLPSLIALVYYNRKRKLLFHFHFQMYTSSKFNIMWWYGYHYHIIKVRQQEQSSISIVISSS